ncbi:MAG: hypothetical protein MZV63_21255 [Marinilabiliales bacterium]|nr:hypothetical protein [Marinilabiliales bacterium]
MRSSPDDVALISDEMTLSKVILNRKYIHGCYHVRLPDNELKLPTKVWSSFLCQWKSTPIVTAWRVKLQLSCTDPV